jgi:hypothetical protein
MANTVFSSELNKEVTLSTRRATVGDYTYYDSKIWRVTATVGYGITMSMLLERKNAKEEIWVRNPEIKTLFEVIKPSGYIPI